MGLMVRGDGDTFSSGPRLLREGHVCGHRTGGVVVDRLVQKSAGLAVARTVYI